ncbi:hypothetical protein ACFSQT_03545 [Mesorhizobium calcicola]|uniref:Uncharacterized protein n=1 Tax=Mesorhizobium calcicola TaxID=1300310 RepID=A0ABW4W6Z9_9HYPH
MHAAISEKTAPEIQSLGDRRMWGLEEAQSLHDSPFNDLLFQAQTVHRQNFDPQQGPAQPASQHQDRADVRRIAAIAASRRITKAG